ncbi:MAG: helix-turn-helix transcriptional regulator [Pseudomonadota bacterium]
MSLTTPPPRDANHVNPEVTARRLRELDDLQPPLVVTSFLWGAQDLPRTHRHRRGQLVFSGENVVTVTTGRIRIVVPPNRGVWVPPEVPHETMGHGMIRMQSVFVRPDHLEGLPDRCVAVAISPLLRELIHASAGSTDEILPGTPDERIALVILDQLRVLPVVALQLPMPIDRRICAVCDALLSNPADERTLPEWGQAVGASTRTLSRLFQDETGMAFHHWRQQARLLAALPRLADGESITNVALDLGYQTPSAFISMFKSVMGVTPGAYFEDAGRSQRKEHDEAD